jgi:predicted Zn-dependent peptidase
MSFITEDLNNGIKLIYKQVLSTRLSHIGVTFNTGSRDEADDEVGLAHLLEHMLFKGTEKRNWRQILNSIEMVGGEMNAYTTKEKTCLYASLISDHTRLAIDLLADISLHSVFPEAELEKEKKVISDEIDMYADSPEEMIVDEFYERVFSNHALGANILGPKEKVLSYTRNDVLRFVAKLHNQGHMVVSYSGPVNLYKIKNWCVNAFSNGTLNQTEVVRKAPNSYKPFTIEKATQHHQCHVVYGNIAANMYHKQRMTGLLLANILGGPALNSILNISLREKNGLTYGVDASYNYYSDAGLFYIQWTADAENLKKSLKIVKQEVLKFASKPFSAKQLELYKTQFKGQLIMSEESNQGLMLMMGRSYLDFGEIEPLEKVLAEIDAIDAEQIQTLARKIFNPETMSLLTYKSGDAPPKE